MSEQGVGASVLRKEDDRLMRGRGQFVADLRFAGMRDVAFVRSPVAHANIRGVVIPPAHRGAIFTAEDLVGVKPIRGSSCFGRRCPAHRGFRLRAFGRDALRAGPGPVEQIDMELHAIVAVDDFGDVDRHAFTIDHDAVALGSRRASGT